MTPPTVSKARSIGLFLLTVTVLETLTIARMPPDWPSEWDQATAMVVTNSVHRKVVDGMNAPLADPFTADLKHTVGWNEADPDRHYLKQFGGEVFLLTAFAPSDAERLEDYLLASRYAAATFSITVVALVIVLLARRRGLATGIAMLAFLAADLRYVAFLRSPYWLPGLCLLPLVVVLALYSPDATPVRKRWTTLLFGGAICLRALCGYEHISVPVLTSCAAILFCGAGASRRTLLRDCIAFVVAGGIGTAAAIAIHFTSLYWAFGSWHEAYENTIGNAIRRSFGQHETVQNVNTLRAQLFGIYGTLAQNKLLTIVLGLWGLATSVYLLFRRRISAATLDAGRLQAAALAGLAAMGATCSWLVLMRAHTALHPQYNNLAFYQGFIWFAVPFLVAIAEYAWNASRRSTSSKV